MTTTTPTEKQALKQQFRNLLFLDHYYKTQLSGMTAERCCRTLPSSTNGHVGLELRLYGDGRKHASASNLQRSRSHTCPVSNYLQQVKNKSELRYLTEQHYKAGGTVLMGTFTLRNASSQTPPFFYSQREEFRRAYKNIDNPVTGIDPAASFYEAEKAGFAEWHAQNPQANSWDAWDLTKQLDALNAGVSAMFDAGDRWKRNKEMFQVIGRVLSVEVVSTPSTITLPDGTTRTSWKKARHHAHVHYMLFIARNDITPAEVEFLRKKLHGRWNNGVTKHGYTSALAGQQLELLETVEEAVKAAEYVAKGGNNGWTYNTAIREGTDPSAAKDMFRPLRDAAYALGHSDGDPYAGLMWRNLEGALFRRRMIRTSIPLAQRYNLSAYRDTQAEERRAAVKQVEQLCFFDRATWSQLLKESPQLRTELLTIAENEGAEVVRQLLDDLEIPYHLTQREAVSRTPAPVPAPRSVGEPAAPAAPVVEVEGPLVELAVAA